MNEAANKRLALEWVAASVAGDVAKVRALYAPDCRFLVAGDMPYCGWMDLEAFFKQTALLPLDGPITMEIGDVTAEGDRVWFEAQSSARLKDGSKYENAYVFFMRIRAGAIVEYKEFVDTYYVYRLIDSPQTRGEPQPRYRIFDQASQSYSGNAIGEAVRGQGTQPQR